MKFPIPILNEFFQNNTILSQKRAISVFGEFGVGKTTFALQTALINVNLGRKVIFIYSKPHLPYHKVKCLFHPRSQEKYSEIQENFVFIKVLNFEDLYTTIFNLEFLILKDLNQKKKIPNVIVIDSLTELYRLELNRDKKEKNVNLNFQLNQVYANLAFLREFYDIGILVVNELSWKSQNDKLIGVQSGGKVAYYWIPYSIKISRTDKLNERSFTVFKSKIKKQLEFTSHLTEKGFEQFNARKTEK